MVCKQILHDDLGVKFVDYSTITIKGSFKIYSEIYKKEIVIIIIIIPHPLKLLDLLWRPAPSRVRTKEIWKFM